MTNFEITGDRELIEAMRHATADVLEGVARAVTASALGLQGDVKQRVIRGPATGIVYNKSTTTTTRRLRNFFRAERTTRYRTHQASAPDEAPATDTGRLANSIDFDVVDRFTATVGSKLVYAAALEFGVPSRKLRPRPYFTPAVEAMRPRHKARLEAAIRGAL